MEKLNETLPEPLKTEIQFKIKDKYFTIVNKSTKPIVISLPTYLQKLLGFNDEETENYYNVYSASNVVNIGVDANSEFVSQNQIEECKKNPEIIENKQKQKMFFNVKEEIISFKDKTYSSKIIPDIICHDEISLTDALIDKLNEVLTEPVNTMIQFKIENRYLTIINKSPELIQVGLPEFLKKPLGYNNEDIILNKVLNLFSFNVGGNEKYVAQNKIEVCNQIPGVMVLYANFVQHSIVGNNFYPILKIIPTNVNQETKIYINTF